MIIDAEDQWPLLADVVGLGYPCRQVSRNWLGVTSGHRNRRSARAAC